MVRMATVSMGRGGRNSSKYRISPLRASIAERTRVPESLTTLVKISRARHHFMT
jgi:hypothetical protein